MGPAGPALRPPLQSPSWQSSVLPVPENSREREQTAHFPLVKSFANGIGRGALSGMVRLVCAALPQAMNYLAQPKRKPSRQETRQSNSPARLKNLSTTRFAAPTKSAKTKRKETVQRTSDCVTHPASCLAVVRPPREELADYGEVEESRKILVEISEIVLTVTTVY